MKYVDVDLLRWFPEGTMFDWNGYDRAVPSEARAVLGLPVVGVEGVGPGEVILVGRNGSAVKVVDLGTEE